MSNPLVEELSSLLQQGVALSDAGLLDESPEIIQWTRTCRSSLISLYSKKSNEEIGFKKSPSHDGRLSTLKVLIAKENSKISRYSGPSTLINLNQSQITNIQNEISMQVLLNIRYSDIAEDKKKEAEALFEEVKVEVQKDVTNWNKVVGLLRKSLDYGLRIAPEIIKFADTYYKAKGGA